MKNSKKYKHPVGMAIIEHLKDVPLSANELAERIDFPREKIYYHIKKLEKMDLIYVAKTQIINGITKKSFLKTDVGENDSDVIGSVKDLYRPEEEPISDSDSEFSPEGGDVSGEEEQYDSEDDIEETEEDTGQDVPNDDLIEKLPQEDKNITGESQKTDFEGDIQDDSDIGSEEDNNNVEIESDEHDSSPLTEEEDESAVSEDLSSLEPENADQLKELELNEADSDSIIDPNVETPTKDSVLGKLLSGENLPDNVETEEKLYDDTAEKDDLSETIIIENVVYLLPKADQSLSGIDYMVRSAQRKDGKAITLEDKESLRSHFETERVEKSEGEIEISPESIESEIHVAKKSEKSKRQGSSSWGLYLSRRLSGYYNSITFSQIDNSVKYLRATLSRRGIKIHDQETFSIPFNDNGETVGDLPSVIRFIYTNRIKKNKWKKYYLAYHTNKYSIEIDPLKTPEIKGKELESFITTNMAKRLSLDPENAIMSWVKNSGTVGDPQNNYIVSVGDMDRIQRDYEQLIDNKIQPRYTTTLAKIQFDLYRYNYPDTKGDAVLIAFGMVKTYITVVNNWEIKDSRTSVVSANDFIPLVTLPDEEELLIEKGNNGGEKIVETTIQLKAIDIKNNNKHVAIWEKLAAEIYVTLKYFKDQGHYISDDIYISGSGTSINNIEDCLSDDLGKNVTKIVFPETVSYDENVDLSQNVDFSTNIGLLLDPKDRLNVLPVEQRNNVKYLYPLNLARIVGALLLTLGSLFTINNYLNLQEIKGQLSETRNELVSMSQQNTLYYGIAYKLAITDLIIGTKDYDNYASTSVLNNLKFLSSSIPENILLDQYIFSRGEGGANPIITIMGKISAPGSESNMVLNSLLYALRDSKSLTQVSLRDQETAENGIVRFTLDLTL
jgi:DNA-binding transcriptional ArsR family regulator